MKEYVEILCYSERQRELLRASGRDAGVVLIEESTRPVLTTETISNMVFGTVYDHEPPTLQEATSLKSHWDDAIIVHTSGGGGYRRLVNGQGKVTDDGEAWCTANGVTASPEAVRTAAAAPQLTMNRLTLAPRR